MQWKLNLIQVICLQMGRITEAKSRRVNLRSPLPRIHYYQSQAVTSKKNPIPNTNLQLNLTLIPKWICIVVTISPFNARIPVRD